MGLYRIIVLGVLLCLLTSEAAFSVQNSNKRSLKEQVDSLNALARQYSFFQENSRNTTYRYASEALSLAEKVDYKEGMVEALDMITYWTIIVGRIETALVLGFRQYRLAEDIGNPLLIARAQRNVGFAAGQQTKSDSLSRQQARTQLNKALATARSFRDTLLEASCLNSLGRLCRVEQNFNAALSFHESALGQARAIHNTEQESWALHSIGVIYEARKQYDTALVFARQALEIRVAAGQAFGEAVSLRLLGLLCYRQKKYSAALEYIQQSIEKCRNLEGLFIVKVDAHRLLTAICKDMGDPHKELLAYRSFLAIKDSADVIEAQNNIAAFQARLDIERSEAEKQILLRDNRIQDIQIQRERMMTLGIISGSVLLLFIIGFMIKAVQTTKQKNQQLQVANKEIQIQKSILEEQATEIEIANTQLQEQNQVLLALNSEKNEFMAIVSHDLKNPISAMRGLAELVQQGYVEPRQVPEILGQIVATADRMLELVKNVLDDNQLESGAMQFQAIEFDITPIVESTVWQYQMQAKAKNITLHFASEAASSLVTADELSTIQVLDNLISNAVKYSPLGKNVYVRVRAGNEMVRLEVQDEGPGISPDDMPKLFGKFARLSARPTGNEHSTGLGLSIVKKMVEAMNGCVWCESELGKGATFIVELPLAKR
jgi:signal transduction histidine kinase